MCITIPVHQVDKHLWILLMFFHFDSIGKNHVQIENQILDLNVQHRMSLKSLSH